MPINCYEYSSIKNKNLPLSWQSAEALDELEDFLQQNWEQRSVFYEDGEVLSKQQFLKFLSHGVIKPSNYIGTIIFRNEQLNIYPKMFRVDKDDHDTEDLNQDHLMKNLINWLEYCNKVDYPFINVSMDVTDVNNLKDLFIALFVGYVQTAVNRGLYFQYVEDTSDIRTIKGKFDLKDYVTYKIPYKQIDQFKCTYSNFEFDNKVNQIIKYTCKYLINIASGKYQKLLRNILIRLDKVSDMYCMPSDCDKIRLSKMHKNYRIILSMCKMFLLNKTSDYSIGSQESFCFLFPAEVLFEGFIGGFMQEVVEGYTGKVKLQQSEMSLVDDIEYREESLGAAFRMRHDILVEVKDKIFILDTKYKEISRFADNPDKVKQVVSEEIHQGDLYQVCEYARKRGLTDVFLLYPMYRYEEVEKDFPTAVSRSGCDSINIHIVRLPFIFEDDVDLVKKQLSDVIKQILSLE